MNGFAISFRFLLRYLAVFAMLGLWPSAHAWAERFGDLEISVLPQPILEGASSNPRGYVEHRIAVRNHSEKTPHTVRFIFPATRVNTRYDSLERATKTVRIAPDSRQVVSFYQPPLATFGSSLAIEIDRVRQENELIIENHHGRQRASGAPGEAILVSRGVSQDFRDHLRSIHGKLLVLFRSELPVQEWSPNWLGYTAYSAILLTDKEAATLPADVMQALRRYVEAGGLLLIQGDGDDEQALIPLGLRDGAIDSNQVGTYAVGLGSVQVCRSPEQVPVSSLRSYGHGAASENLTYVVTSEYQVPIRGLLTLVILFAVVIGPLNIWFLSRRGRRMWLWWNVPLMSLVTCLLIFTYSLLAEGVTGRGKIVVLTILDENNHHATTIGYASFYSPLTPSDGLHFSSETEVTPVAMSSLYSNRFRGEPAEGSPKSIDWTNDQHLQSGWIMSRIPAIFAVRKSDTRRERMSFRQSPGGDVMAVNGLGARIQKLTYLDNEGRIWTGQDITPGGEQTLKLKSSHQQAMAPLRNLHESSWQRGLRELQSEPETYLKPGRYVAVIESSPFIENPLPWTRDEGSFGVVYGICERGNNGHSN